MGISDRNSWLRKYMEIGVMVQGIARRLILSATIVWVPFLFAQPQEGEVSHWEDGTSMGCTYIFKQENFHEWDQRDPRPVDIQTAAAFARHHGESKNLNNVSVKSFRLIGVKPLGHDYPMLVMFVNYLGFPSGVSIVRGDEDYWIAITPTGAVVEPECE